jgi:Tfp pilus assembly protein PilV
MRISGSSAQRASPRDDARRQRLRADDGFTLFEVLIAVTVLVAGLGALFGLLDDSLKATSSTRAREGATNLARQLLEDARTIPYAQLSPSAITGELQAMDSMADASPAAGWQVMRRASEGQAAVTYTVTAQECAIDDPKDGYGVHVNSYGENPFCKDAGEREGTEKEDPQPEDLKRVTVDVTWTGQGRTHDVREVETLTVAGEAPGLTASNLHLESPTVAKPTEPVIVEEPASGTLTFAVSSPSGTNGMRWSLEGNAQPSAPVLKSGTTWTFSWSIPYPGVSDGTYLVSVQAIDATGVTGPPVSIPVTLIRGTPAAVSGLRGGFNEVGAEGVRTKVVELQWQANTERNVVGYRVYSPSGQRVCPASEATLSVAVTCLDFSPPSPASPNLTYSAVALYRDAGGVVRQGPAGTFTVLGGPPPAPNPPSKLELAKNPDGSVTLTWSAPTGGPGISFYRIYRGSTDYTSRYDVATVPATTYTDTDAVIPHNYWVTAVDANLTESTPLGPVNG